MRVLFGTCTKGTVADVNGDDLLPRTTTRSSRPRNKTIKGNLASGGRVFDRAPRSALRLLEPRVLFAVVVHDFDAPAHRIPAENLFGGRG